MYSVFNLLFFSAHFPLTVKVSSLHVNVYTFQRAKLKKGFIQRLGGE